MLQDYVSDISEAVHFDHLESHVRLGKLAKKEDDRTLQLVKYLGIEEVKLPAPPAAVTWDKSVHTWPMYDNDRLGNCTCAAAGHVVQGETGAAGKLVTPPVKAVDDLYWSTGTEDNGRMCLDVLNKWHKTGLDGKNAIFAFAEVNPKDHVQVEQAMAIFGNVYMGAGLPIAVQGKTAWHTLPNLNGDNEPGSWGGHCINGIDYVSKEGITVVTWGGLLKVDWGFLDQCCDEMYVVLTKDWLDKASNSPAAAGGVNFAQLEKDLAAIH